MTAVQTARETESSPISMFVSTALDTWTTERAGFARDVQIDDTAYRRLDPEYYAWLRSRIVLAQKAVTAGRLDLAAFEELRVRFNAVHEWAVEHFGEAQLLAAMRTFRAGHYTPPVAEDQRLAKAARHDPAPQVRKSAGGTISPEAMAQVEAISERALSLGWKRERLYGTGGGIFDPQRGLVCFIKPGDRIGAVTLQSIEIVGPPPGEVRHRFYNPDAEQPWIVRRDQKKP